MALHNPLFLLLRIAILVLIPGFTNTYSPLSDTTLQRIPNPGTSFDIHNGSLLSPLLIPRVPGTLSHDDALDHLVTFFRTSLPNWTLEFQNSTQKTPISGNDYVPFTNLIATRAPPWAQPGEVSYLTLAAHYDSKYSPAGFIGATDSAAPCAMILQIARSVDAALTRKWDSMNAEEASMDGEKGVQVLLLDGEESWIRWTETDSLFGARSLAETWEKTYHPALSTYRTPLSSISLFLLLDLLGAAAPKIPSYFSTTHWSYQSLSRLEERMRGLHLFASHGANPEPWLYDTVKEIIDFRMGYGIADDHVPFLKRGVEVLHMIPSPFPRVWHEMDDDGEHLDTNTVRDWAVLGTAFVGEWMELEGFFEEGDGQAWGGGGTLDRAGRRHIVRSKTEL
ncbi:MAG: hypothetical protein M1824_001426 [Vezdaea acicularis]|nr:MAG: hypothetical protein M1824_001426 [Vezdaea acicularis]